MDARDIQRMKALNQRKSKTEEQNRCRVVSDIQNYLSKRGYRADLVLVANSRRTSGSFPIEIKFNGKLGYPSESDVMTIVSKNFPRHSIDWGTIELDTDSSVITVNLEPSVEVIPLQNISEIPPEFQAVGTGIYKRAADATGDVQEIWSLKKDENGLALYRNHNDVEILEDDEDKFVAGSIVETPKGVGKILRFDDTGNAIVLVGSRQHLFAASDMKPYKQEKEEKELQDYYEQAYGVKDFAKGLVEDYTSKK